MAFCEHFLAFQWAGKASVEPRKEEAFLLFAISLESLLMERDGRLETTEKRALRGAHIIGGNAASPLTVCRDLKKLYGIRSKIVHSGSVEVGEDQLSESRLAHNVVFPALLGDDDP